MGFFNDEERKPLTRDSEPEEFFATYVSFFKKNRFNRRHGRTTLVYWLIFFVRKMLTSSMLSLYYFTTWVLGFVAVVQFAVPLLPFVISC